MAIQKRTGVNGSISYRVRVRCRPDPMTGERAWLTETFPTKKEDESFERRALLTMEQGTDVDPSRETVAEYLTRWLQSIVQHRNRPRTIACYEGPIRTRIIPALGNLRLQDLRPYHLQDFYSAQLTSPKLQRHKGTLSPRSVRLMHSILHKALKDAERLSLIASNPATKVSPPRVPKPTVQTWHPEHYRAFLAQTVADPYGEALWLTALATGMREGELLDLRWRNVNLERGTITVTEILSIVTKCLKIVPHVAARALGHARG